MRKVMWNKLSEQAQLGTNNAEGREPGGGSHAEPRSAWLAGSSPNFEWKLTNHDHPRCSTITALGHEGGLSGHAYYS